MFGLVAITVNANVVDNFNLKLNSISLNLQLFKVRFRAKKYKINEKFFTLADFK